MAYIPLSGLSLRDIEYVVAVDDLRNFSRAAERCGVSQAGLSEQVRKLEALLDVTIFERSRRHVAPTPDGTRLIALCRDVLVSARTLIEVARARSGPLDGVLRIGVIATLGPYYIPGLLPRLRQKYPQLSLQLTESMTAPMLHKLRHNELDLVLAALPLGSDALHAEPLFEEPFLGVFPRNHALTQTDELSLEELGGSDLLLLEDGHCLRDQALSVCGLSEHGSQRLATSLEMLWHMVGAGEGYSLIPQLALRNRAEMAELVDVRPMTGASRTIGLVWRGSDPRGPAFREFAAFLRDHVPSDCTPIE
ncbi:oxidative stress regulatory protein OxyR [Neoasaia chiangmaiensis NBRC 101099]|uniref:LysR family transcriptional regulator n=1 Tax=Neoasaia chiangmaiensis TaxID=320497 RepID=A0A1U9KSM7_9PROT|nr:hydrogen peroxide-inducible genes activator [Neoasaia chiangmaiensis]AQS88841.1 LysR family transcriptional regulator [Neoasaia chiangmaiensis]GBR40616.1 oxidative stress regulatory protein OxyR [Neoasaia chiangmaiensis NBRC 101099]GEN13815.1 LysR family transcriptional regulator [Neoasaia chiangmaiensis]